MTTYNTGNPVGSTDPRDLYDNAQNLDNLVNGVAATYADRLGVPRRTLSQIDADAQEILSGIGYAPPVAYASGISLTTTTQTVEYSGEVYAPKLADLPFTTSGTFETAKFRLIQGLAAGDLAAPGGSSLVGYLPAGTGAVATDVQSKLRESVSVSGFITPQEAFAAAVGKSLYLDSDVTLTAGQIIDLSACSDLVVWGPGKIIGPSVAVQGQPNAYIKLWGAIAAGVTYGSTIAKSTKSFTITNTFAANDLLMLSNFPTDATDAYTEGSADVFGDKARSYANTSTSNLRQTRRKELTTVRMATGANFELSSGTANAYGSTDGLQFQKITPVEGILFLGVTFENVHINHRYARGITYTACRAKACMMVAQMSVGVNPDFAEWDCQNTDGRIDFFEASRSFKITGNFKNFNTPSENAPVKVLGCIDFVVDAIAEGSIGVQAGHGVMIDTAFVENPSGYSDLPVLTFAVDVNARSCSGSAAALTCDPYSATISSGHVAVVSDDAGATLKGVNNIALDIATCYADGSSNSVFTYGITDCTIAGRVRGGIFESTVVNPRDVSQITSNSGLSNLLAGHATLPSQPAFLAYLTAPQSAVTGDGTEVQIAFNSELYDKTNAHAASAFNAPLSGVYAFTATVKLNGVGAAHTSGWLRFEIDGTSYYLQPSYAALASAVGECALSWSLSVYMAKNSAAKLYIKVNGGAKTIDVQGSGLLETFWTGTLLN